MPMTADISQWSQHMLAFVSVPNILSGLPMSPAAREIFGVSAETAEVILDNPAIFALRLLGRGLAAPQEG